MGALGRHGLTLSRLRFVHPSPAAPARTVLIEARKGRSGHIAVEHPVTIHAAPRVYAEEVAAFIAQLCR
jgi:tRNA1(Val) A37 N6-methylase TrmN6